MHTRPAPHYSHKPISSLLSILALTPCAAPARRCLGPRQECAELLISHGASLRRRDRNNRSALDRARSLSDLPELAGSLLALANNRRLETTVGPAMAAFQAACSPLGLPSLDASSFQADGQPQWWSPDLAAQVQRCNYKLGKDTGLSATGPYGGTAHPDIWLLRAFVYVHIDNLGSGVCGKEDVNEALASYLECFNEAGSPSAGSRPSMDCFFCIF